ncbi:MAG: hypothetical protein HRT53_03415 [Colwellia sp.]|nr:hypothetical protein [Colwellia sp.]
MNKFAPIAFILLLSCGIALWFLASDSLNVHIKSQFQTLASKLSQQNVTVGNVTIRSYQGTGTITNVVINKLNSDGHVSTTLSIESIELAIDRESLKEEIIIIDSITINGLIASYNDTKNGTSLEQLLANVQKNLPLLASINKVNIEKPNKQNQKIAPPHIKVTKVIIKPGVLQYISNNNGQITTEPFPQIEWENINTKLGVSGETVGIKIFEQLLLELTARSNKNLFNN